MPCYHKFRRHIFHLPEPFSLFPDWDVDTLFIGTFNPMNVFAPNNDACYFYGRSRNYLWKILPKFVCQDSINRHDIYGQQEFLKTNKIALTDLLIGIADAEEGNQQHIQWINRYLDNAIDNFNQLLWNTEYIKQYIIDRKIEAVYFTKLGGSGSFELPMIEIENFCNQHGIINHRLHTPSGQGLGVGTPKENKLIQRWYEQGGNDFPFLCSDFDINNFPWQ